MSERTLHEPRLGTEADQFGGTARSYETESRRVPQQRTEVIVQAGPLALGSGKSS